MLQRSCHGVYVYSDMLSGERMCECACVFRMELEQLIGKKKKDCSSPLHVAATMNNSTDTNSGANLPVTSSWQNTKTLHVTFRLAGKAHRFENTRLLCSCEHHRKRTKKQNRTSCANACRANACRAMRASELAGLLRRSSCFASSAV